MYYRHSLSFDVNDNFSSLFHKIIVTDVWFWRLLCRRSACYSLKRDLEDQGSRCLFFKRIGTYSQWSYWRLTSAAELEKSYQSNKPDFAYLKGRV